MKRIYLSLLMILGIALTAGCDSSQQAGGTPPPMVRAMVIETRDVPLSFEYVGQTTGSREVQVRARVGGILLRRTYVEGAAVKQGDLMFVIDPDRSDAGLTQEVGALAKAKAAMENARRERDRIVKLYSSGAVSTQERDDAVTAYESAVASVTAAQGSVRAAQLDVNYSEVRAPISGITSKEVVSEGSLITTDASGSLLTAISQLDPVYVNFSVPGTDALMLRRWHDTGRMTLPESGYSLRLKLADDSIYPVRGSINYYAKQVDPETGSIRVRGEFPNHDSIVLPGQFVRVYVEGGILKNTLLVPQKSVLFTQNGPIVYVLDTGNLAQARPLKLGQTVQDSFIVEQGLKSGERIVSDGIIKVRPNSPVKVAPDQPESNDQSTPAITQGEGEN